jgi:EAL domain-containing protein (putative c-di-GMP-specific phosphodiesterase class I)
VRGGLVSRDNFPVDSPDELLLKSIESRRFATKNHQFIVSANELRSEERQRQEEFGWLNSVSRAVQRKNVVSYAQGVVSVETNQPAFYECLVRIEEEGKIIMPGQFLPVIEGTHLYARLSHQMIKETFRHMRNRTESFSINLSPQDMLSNRTMYLLEQEVVQLKDPSRFGVEVLETEQIKDYNRMREICDHFRAMGVRIVVDDFGSGYSNIDEIIKLEPHIIKVDGSLVRNIDRDPKQRAITEQLVNLCQVFNAKTVAEFVHNKQVADIATDMGFDFLQGFYFFEPKPTELI